MKPIRKNLFFTAAASLLATTATYAADGTWLTDVAGNWSDTANWAGGPPGIIADGADFTATFTNDLTADRIITLDANRTIGNITFGDAATATAGGWTISGANTLTLDRTSGTPTITINALGASKTATISSVIAGNDGLTVTSAGTNGTLTLSGTNTYSGTTTINTQANGAVGVVVANAAAFGTSSVLLKGSNQFNAGISVNSGLDVANALTLQSINSGSGRALLAMNNGSTWSGNITVDSSLAPSGGFAAIATSGSSIANAVTVKNINYISGTNTNALVLRGSNGFGKVTGTVALASATVQLLDSTSWQFSGASNSWGKLDINNASAKVYVGATNTLASNGVVTASGATGGTLFLTDFTGTTGYSQTIAGLTDTSTNKVNVTSAQAATLTLGGTGTYVHSGVISGSVAIERNAASGSQTLSGTNTYSGGTAVTAGTLITGNASALGSGNVSVASGAILQIGNGTSNLVTLGTAATFSTASNTSVLKLGAATSSITMGATGLFTLAAGTDIDITGLGLGAGTYTLINGTAAGSTVGAWNQATDLIGGDLANFSYNFALGGTNDAILTVTAVPEPGAALLGGLGLLGLLRRRRA